MCFSIIFEEKYGGTLLVLQLVWTEIRWVALHVINRILFDYSGEHTFPFLFSVRPSRRVLVSGKSQIVAMEDMPESGTHHGEKNEKDGKEYPEKWNASSGFA